MKNKKHKYSVNIYELYESNGTVENSNIHCEESKSIQKTDGYIRDVTQSMEDFLNTWYYVRTVFTFHIP